MNLAKAYTLKLPEKQKNVITGHLALGGHSRDGHHIAFSNYYMLSDGQPTIPVMGEFHFSRYDYHSWEDELRKVKAGGIDILATYVFWNHIEEDQGIYNWSGSNNLRQFVELCSRHDLQVLVRVGPFAHGECRNGGIPDWLYGQPFPLRSNDAQYLAHIERWYEVISEQLQGLLFRDAGPVIGIQLENEYMHCGAPWEVTFRQGTEWVPAGSDGPEHMAALKSLAQKVGLDVPIYSATGWLRSPIVKNEFLPMQGGYAFTPWSPDPDYQQAPTREFLFRDRHSNPVLAGEPTYDAQRYPYACCEIGGGIQITYYHRPVVPAAAVEALSLVNLAGGANLIGYYMYHGGTHPVGKHSYMNEFTVPRLSYDFQAPIREFGQISSSYGCLRLLHLFLHDYGALLAPMDVVLPEDQAEIAPEDTDKLRYMLRSDGKSGFIFLNNYQDHVEMQDLSGIRFNVSTESEILEIPHAHSLTLHRNVSAILPIGLNLGGIQLKYATTQALCKLQDENLFIFFAPDGMPAEYAFACSSYAGINVSNGSMTETEETTYVNVEPGTDCLIALQTTDGEQIRILTLTRAQAETCQKLHIYGCERLVLSRATLTAQDGTCILYSIGGNDITMSVYPDIEKNLSITQGNLSKTRDGLFTTYTLKLPQKNIALDIETITSDKVRVRFPEKMLEGIHNVILQIDYVGDIGNAYVNGRLVHDNFYNGTTWEIGARQIVPDAQEMLLLITPARAQSGGIRFVPTGMAFRPDAEDALLAEVFDVRAVPEYKAQLLSDV